MTTRIAAPVAMLTVCMVALQGCQTRSDPLPTFPALPAAESLAIIADRLESVKTVSASGQVVLTDASGQSVHLEGVLLSEAPDHLRIRAWKLGHAVLDVTVKGDEVWLKIPEPRDYPTQGGPEPALPHSQIPQFLSLMGPVFFRNATESRSEEASATLTVVGSTPGTAGATLICQIDRSTLTPRRYSGTDDPHAGSVTLSDYRLVGDIPWPTLLTASGEGGTIELRLRDIELNTELPQSAFTPPAGAPRAQ